MTRGTPFLVRRLRAMSGVATPLSSKISCSTPTTEASAQSFGDNR